MHWSLPGSYIHEIFQARILEWVAIPFFRNEPILIQSYGLKSILFSNFFSFCFCFVRCCFFFLIQDPIQNTMLHLSIMFLGSPGLYQFPQFNSVQFSSVQSLSRIWLFATPWITARQASLSITNSWGLLKLMSIESLMPSNHLIIIHPFLLLLPVPPSITVLSSQLFTVGSQIIGLSASASIFPTNTQDWSPLGWTGWISLSFLDLSYFKWDIG